MRVGLQEMGVDKAAMDISLFMKLQKRVRELEQERKRLQSNVDRMEELAKRRVKLLNMLLSPSFSDPIYNLCLPVPGLRGGACSLESRLSAGGG